MNSGSSAGLPIPGVPVLKYLSCERKVDHPIDLAEKVVDRDDAVI